MKNNSVNKDWKFLKNYKNTISNLKLNINLYYKFSKKLPKSYNWYSLKKIKNLFLVLPKEYLIKSQFILMKKKIAIWRWHSRLTLANLVKKFTDHEFMVYEREESLSLEEGYGNSISN